MVEVSFDLKNFEYFLLILVRIASFVFAAPIFGQRGVPSRVKIGLSFFVAVLLYNSIDRPELVYADVIGYAVLVLGEGITGLLIGFATSICSSIIVYAGSLIDMDIGMSMSTQFNPSMSFETTVSGDLYYYSVMLLLMVSDFHTYILRAACDSFVVVPVGHPNFQIDVLLSSATRYIADIFTIGFRIFLPFLAVIMILNCILGIMAKLAPQMNMFAVGIQLKVLTGFAIMFFTAFMIPNIADFVFREVKEMVVLFIEAMY